MPEARSAEVTGALELEPTDYGDTGDVFISSQRQPPFRAGGSRTHALWALTVEHDGEDTGQDSRESFSSLRVLLGRLSGKRSALDGLAERFDVRLAWWAGSGSSQATMILEPSDVELLHELGLPLMGTVYFDVDKTD